MTSMFFRYLTFVLLGMGVTGCGRVPQGFPPVVPCKITVVKGDVPLPEVNIMFITDGGSQWFAAGQSDSSGVAELQTFMEVYTKNGVPEGTYKVTLSQLSQVKSGWTQQQLFDMSPAEKEAESQRMGKLLAESRSFPVEFENAATTPIIVEVQKPRTDIRLDVTEWIGKQ